MKRARLLLHLAIAAGASLLAAAPATEIAWDLDAARSTVAFTLGDVLHTVRGTFKLKRGAVHFDPATGKISGEVVIDATTGESGSEGRDKRMHKAILESARYPEITFAPDRVDGTVAPEGVSKIQVHGLFRIHGASHEISLPVEVHMGGGQPFATTHFVIPYVKWGMRNPSTFILRVSEQVNIDATAYAR